jgi:tRNA (cmo5U34)-methyltransferase
MAKDTIFSRPQEKVTPFEFNAQVAEVFDDMLGRSVPLYRESIVRQAQLAARFYQSGSRIYDLGCSNGNLGLALCRQMGERDFTMVSIDNSQPMLDTYRRRLHGLAGSRRIVLEQGDIRQVAMERASVVIVNLTLQFLPLADRDTLIRRIYQALIPGGILLLTEKVVHEDTGLTELEQEFYYRFKEENGYSQMEISRKREALENVLIPETLANHDRRLRQAGFVAVEIWLKWFNFAALLAQKGA